MSFDNPTATVVLGDCADVLGTIPQRFRLVLTSTPYPGLRGFDLTWAEYWPWARKRFALVKHVLVPAGGAIALVINARRANIPDLFDFYRELWNPLGFTHENLYVWDKLNAPPAGNLKRYDHDMWEFIFVVAAGTPHYQPYREPYAPKSSVAGEVAAKSRLPSVVGNMAGGHTKLHPKGARQGNVIRLSPSGGQEVDRPRAVGGSFPLALAERFIHQFSEPGDWVLDPFCGAGTTLVTARSLGRNSVGVEIDPTTFGEAVRWLHETSKTD